MLGAFKGDGWARSLAALIHRRAGAIVLVALVLTAAAGWMASNLKVDQEMRRLLPDDFPSVVRLDRLQDEIGQQSHLYVTIRSPDREANIAFGRGVYERIAQREDIRYVLFERDLTFFDDHALLYASMGDLIDLRRRVILRIREEVRKQAYGDFSVLTEEERNANKPSAEKAANDLGFDVDEVKSKYGLKDAAAEYMETDEGRVMVVKIRPTAPSTDVAFSNKLSSDIRAIVDELGPASFHPEMEVDLNGAYVQHAKRVKDVQTEIYGGAFCSGRAVAAHAGGLLPQRAVDSADFRAAAGLCRGGVGVRLAGLRRSQPRERIHLRGAAGVGDRLWDPRAVADPSGAGPRATVRRCDSRRACDERADDGGRGRLDRAGLRGAHRGGLSGLRSVRHACRRRGRARVGRRGRSDALAHGGVGPRASLDSAGAGELSGDGTVGTTVSDPRPDAWPGAGWAWRCGPGQTSISWSSSTISSSSADVARRPRGRARRAIATRPGAPRRSIP